MAEGHKRHDIFHLKIKSKFEKKPTPLFRYRDYLRMEQRRYTRGTSNDGTKQVHHDALLHQSHLQWLFHLAG